MPKTRTPLLRLLNSSVDTVPLTDEDPTPYIAPARSRSDPAVAGSYPRRSTWRSRLEEPVVTGRRQMDIADYARRSREEPCFICKVIDGTADHQHQVVYRSDQAIAFLNRYPTLLGYCLVAPIEHREAVVADFPVDDYLRLQRVVHRVGTAVSRVVPTERLYLLSLGSDQGNAHVHWHVAPLPPDVPYDEQQFHALRFETAGVLDLSPDDQEQLAARIRNELETCG